MRDNLEHYKRTISCQHYWSMIKCPALFLGATNDFNSPTESVVRGMSNLPKSTDRRLVLAPHLNHRFTTSCDVARILWMEAHLKGSLAFPKTPKTELILKTKDGRPVFKVWPDVSPQNKLKAVDVYYGYARDPRIRFWRDGMAKKVGDHYEAVCPVFDANEPLFVFANVTYRTGRVIPIPRGHRATDEVTVSTKYWMVYPEHLKEAGVKATETRHRLIDDFSRGWHDWYRLSWSHSDHWYAAPRKVLDPSWMGPKGGKLCVELSPGEAGNRLAVIAEVNTWQGYTGRRKDTFHAIVDLAKKGRTSFALNAGDFKNAKGEALKDWDELTELAFTPSIKAKISGKQPKWKGRAPEFHKVHWVGGKLIPRPYPHQVRGKAPKRKAPISTVSSRRRSTTRSSWRSRTRSHRRRNDGQENHNLFVWCGDLVITGCDDQKRGEQAMKQIPEKQKKIETMATKAEPPDVPLRNRDYSHAFWPNGFRKEKGDASANVFAVEAGHYGFSFDLADFRKARLGKIEGSGYKAAGSTGDKTVNALPKADLKIEIEHKGKV